MVWGLKPLNVYSSLSQSPRSPFIIPLLFLIIYSHINSSLKHFPSVYNLNNLNFKNLEKYGKIVQSYRMYAKLRFQVPERRL